jgi:hypothetical protein
VEISPMSFALHGRIAMAVLSAVAVCGSAAARADEFEHSAGHCQEDALKKWYCAEDAKGSAVVDSLGRVLCAPGACVRQDTQDTKQEWLCSSESGGRAVAVPAGPPECDGKCRAPETTACKQL